MPRSALLLVLLLTNSLAFAQEEPPRIEEAAEADAARPPEFPADLQDPAFAKYVKLDFLASACKTLDPAALADAGLQLAHGERVLFRPHKAVAAKTILDLAVKAATDQRDLETLKRLAKASSALGDKKLSDRIGLAKKLAAQPRAATPPVQVDLTELTAEQVQYYQVTKAEIDRARIRGDKARLEEMDFHVAHSSLPKGLRNRLASAITSSQEATSDAKTMEAVGKLAAVSRYVTGPYYFTIINQTTKTVRVQVDCKALYPPSFSGGMKVLKPTSGAFIPPGKFYQFLAMSSSPLLQYKNEARVFVDKTLYRARRRLGGGSYLDDNVIHATGWYIRRKYSASKKLVYERNTPN